MDTEKTARQMAGVLFDVLRRLVNEVVVRRTIPSRGSHRRRSTHHPPRPTCVCVYCHDLGAKSWIYNYKLSQPGNIVGHTTEVVVVVAVVVVV